MRRRHARTEHRIDLSHVWPIEQIEGLRPENEVQPIVQREERGVAKRALNEDPDNGAYQDSLGWAYFKLGKYDLAEETLNKASLRMGSDPTVQDHLGDLYQKTGRLKLAAAHWERAVEEWNKTVPAEQDGDLMASTQKKLDAAKVRLAKEDADKR